MRNFPRRGILQGLAGLGAALALDVRPAAAQKAKVSKAIAKYRYFPVDGAMCAECIHFQLPVRCNRVEGIIYSKGYCRFFNDEK